jgi:hypothetical protein
MTTCTRSAGSRLTDFFSSDDIEATARRTGFVKRVSKLRGKLFLALVTFGAWSDATTTLAQLAAKVTQLDEQVEVSPEAIHQLSLSRLNHRLPGRKAHAEVVQSTTECHHEIANARLPQAEPVFDDAAALDTAVHGLNP